MFRNALRLVTIFLLIQSLLLSSLAAPQPEDKPTPLEVAKTRKAANLFMKRLEETGDLSRVIDELYVEDFIWRYIQEQKRELAESHSSSAVFLAPGLSYKTELLTQATEQDWRRLYVATYNFFYHVMLIGLNQYAGDILNDNDLDEDALNKLLPSNVTTLLDAHPILKNFFEAKGEPKDIETLEEMHSVCDTLEQSLQLLLDAQPNRFISPNIECRQVFENFNQTEFSNLGVEIYDHESFGYPAGTRMLYALVPIFFGLRLVEVNCTLKIVWAELFAEI